MKTNTRQHPCGFYEARTDVRSGDKAYPRLGAQGCSWRVVLANWFSELFRHLSRDHQNPSTLKAQIIPYSTRRRVTHDSYCREIGNDVSADRYLVAGLGDAIFTLKPTANKGASR